MNEEHPGDRRAHRVGLWRRIRRFATYLLIRAFLAWLALLWFGAARAWARSVAWLVWCVVRRERERTIEHVRAAFPEWSPDEVERVARESLLQLGEAAAEIAHIDRLRRRLDETVECSAEDRAWIEAALAAKRGVLVVAGHIGNWELLGVYLAARGYPVRTLARGQSDPRLSEYVRRFRGSRGVHTILRHDPGAARAMLRVFREGAILGFFLDQDTDVPGVFVPFFGRPAWTPSGAATLALRTGCAVCVAVMHRVGRLRHRLRILPIDFDAGGERERDVARLTATLTRHLEDAIRQAPEQWVWIHQRWRRRP